MNPQQPASERQDGWYWVRWTGPNGVLFDWRIRQWEDGEFIACRFQPEIVGPRIPSPDEQPAPKIGNCRHLSISREFADLNNPLSIGDWVCDDCESLMQVSRVGEQPAPRDAAPNSDVILRSIEASLGTLDHSAAIDSDDWREQIEAKVATLVAAFGPVPFSTRLHDAAPACPVSAQECESMAKYFDGQNWPNHAMKIRILRDWLEARGAR